MDLGLGKTPPTFQQEYLAFLKRHEHSTHSTRCRLLMPGLRFDDKYLWDRQRTSAVPPGRGSLHRYPGTSCLATIGLSLQDKSHSPIEVPRIKLALIGLRPPGWVV